MSCFHFHSTTFPFLLFFSSLCLPRVSYINSLILISFLSFLTALLSLSCQYFVSLLTSIFFLDSFFFISVTFLLSFLHTLLYHAFFLHLLHTYKLKFLVSLFRVKKQQQTNFSSISFSRSLFILPFISPLFFLFTLICFTVFHFSFHRIFLPFLFIFLSLSFVTFSHHRTLQASCSTIPYLTNHRIFSLVVLSLLNDFTSYFLLSELVSNFFSLASFYHFALLFRCFFPFIDPCSSSSLPFFSPICFYPLLQFHTSPLFSFFAKLIRSYSSRFHVYTSQFQAPKNSRQRDRNIRVTEIHKTLVWGQKRVVMVVWISRGNW